MKQVIDIESGNRDNKLLKNLLHHWLGLALLFFFSISILGVLLRYYFVGEIASFRFNDLKHAHSHGAMLGWAYLASLGLLIASFIKNTKRVGGYTFVLTLSVFSAIGMIFSFPFEGYGLYSISFSTIHVLVSYYFAFLFLRDLRNSSVPGRISYKLARWSIYWMLISTLGLWAVGPVSVFLGGLHPAYYMSIQWYLHFQFIGWFTFVVLAACFKLLEDHKLAIHLPKSTFPMLQITVILTYALSVSWSSPSEILFYLNAVGVLLQAWVFYHLLKAIFSGLKIIEFDGMRFMKWLLQAGLVILAFRVFIQMLAVVPAVAEIAYTLRMFVVAFIHLMMMGTFTLVAVALLHKNLYKKTERIGLTAWLIYFIGFVITELMLFGQGTLLWAKLGFLPDFYYYLLIFSLLFPLSLFFATMNHYLFQKKNIISFNYQ